MVEVVEVVLRLRGYSHTTIAVQWIQALHRSCPCILMGVRLQVREQRPSQRRITMYPMCLSKHLRKDKYKEEYLPAKEVKI